MGSPAIIRLCHYSYCIFHNHNHIGVATWRAGGLQPPVKDRDTLIEQLVTRINGAHRQIYEANKDSETYVASTLQARQTTESI